MNNERAELIPGDRTLTRRILKRCRDGGHHFDVETEMVRIGRDRYGSKTIAYHVPRSIFEEESARWEEELRLKAEAVERKLEKARVEARQKLIASLIEKFPQVPEHQLEKLVDTGNRVFSPQETGYQFGVGTRAYWQQLGFAVKGESSGVVIHQKRIFKTYDTSVLRQIKRRVSESTLLSRWRKKYGSDAVVLAQAVRFGNRLQKVKKLPSFYTLKDEWIRANQCNLISGRETRTCWDCDGTGKRYYGDDCWKCDGTGIYSSRTLYEHRFDIEGTTFTFHSYVKPKTVAEEQAENRRVFGRPFKKDELPCPPQHVIISVIETLLKCGGGTNQQCPSPRQQQV